MKNSRRDFIKTTSAGAVTALAGSAFPGFAAGSYDRIKGPMTGSTWPLSGFITAA